MGFDCAWNPAGAFDEKLRWQGDSRIRYEPGAEAAAGTVAGALASSIETIERAHFRPFAKPVRVFVCASKTTFQRYGYRLGNAGGYVLNGRVFISPKPENTSERLPRLLTHELSHLHLEQHLGLLDFARYVPGWFREGLAVSISGNGAETVTEAKGREAILRGKVFRLDGVGSLLSPQTAARDGLDVHLFYRERAKFVRFLAENKQPAFKRLLLDLQDGKHFELHSKWRTAPSSNRCGQPTSLDSDESLLTHSRSRANVRPTRNAIGHSIRRVEASSPQSGFSFVASAGNGFSPTASM